MSEESDSEAYSAARAGLESSVARSVAFKWFLIGKFLMTGILAGTYALVQDTVVGAVTAVPWQLSGLTFFAMVVVIGAPAMLVGGGCMLYGVFKAVKIDTH